jgi:2-pyrone-4,6-dicarboxylate lactonase
MIAAMRNRLDDLKHRAPSQPLPMHAADCHMHVFGPYERFPLAALRAYNVDEAPLAAHERMKAAVGLERTVLVQPSGHGDDNRALLEALAALGRRGRAVAVLPLDVPADELQRLHAAGVRGLRLNLVTLGARHADNGLQSIAHYGRKLASLGWHLQVFASIVALESLAPVLRDCPVPVVIDHMGLPDAAAGIAQPGFQALLGLMEAGHVWAKLSGADRVTRGTGRLRDAIPFMRALAAAAPGRLVWGSDWPHIGFHARATVREGELTEYRALDAGELLDLLVEAVPDAALRRAILADNPARLYGFDCEVSKKPLADDAGTANHDGSLRRSSG